MLMHGLILDSTIEYVVRIRVQREDYKTRYFNTLSRK